MFSKKLTELTDFISTQMKKSSIYPDLMAFIAAIEQDIKNAESTPQFAYYEILAYFTIVHEENFPLINLKKALHDLNIPPEEFQFAVLFSRVKKILSLEFIETISKNISSSEKYLDTIKESNRLIAEKLYELYLNTNDLDLKALCEENIIGHLIKSPFENEIRPKIVNLKSAAFPLTVEDFIFYKLTNQPNQIKFYDDIVKLLASLNTLNVMAFRSTITINNRNIPINTLHFSKYLQPAVHHFIERINGLYKKCTDTKEKDNLGLLLCSVVELIDKSKQMQAKFLFLKKETNLRFFVSSTGKKLYRKQWLVNLDQEYKDILDTIELIKSNDYLKNHPDLHRYFSLITNIGALISLVVLLIALLLMLLPAPLIWVEMMLLLSPGIIIAEVVIFPIFLLLYWLVDTPDPIHDVLEPIIQYKQQNELVYKEIKEMEEYDEEEPPDSNQLNS